MSWGYYVFNGTQPDCDDNAMFCKAVPQNAKTPGIWNPLPYFDTVRQDHQLGEHRAVRGLPRRGEGRNAARRSRGSRPTQKVSDHPPALIRTGRPTSPA